MNWSCPALVIQQTFAKSLLWVTTVAPKHRQNFRARVLGKNPQARKTEPRSQLDRTGSGGKETEIESCA